MHTGLESATTFKRKKKARDGESRGNVEHAHAHTTNRKEDEKRSEEEELKVNKQISSTSVAVENKAGRVPCFSM